MKRIITLVLSLVSLVAEAQTIRVLILNGKEKVEVSAISRLEIRREDKAPILIAGVHKASCTISLSGEKLLVAGIEESRSPILIRSDPPLPIRVNGQRYRGEIEVRRGKSGIDVINIIDLEEYLYGVIKWEISPTWSMEMVKAQAVAARTFAYFNLGCHQKDGYDLCNTYHCQVYGGMEAEDPRSIEAVDATRGEVLIYNGELVNAIYHATCGGHTAEASLVWPGKRWEYLKGVECPFCQKSPYYFWHYQTTLDKIQVDLKRKKDNIGQIYQIYPSKRDRFGRIEELVIIHSQGETRMRANDFRLALGPRNVRSTIFELTKIDNNIIFNGVGWGHGVGMCQWGGKEMAELGFNYQQILKYYYPETQILKFNK